MQNLLEHGKTLAVGTAGMIASIQTPELLAAMPNDIGSIAQAVTQAAIAIATLIGLFKKKKGKKTE